MLCVFVDAWMQWVDAMRWGRLTGRRWPARPPGPCACSLPSRGSSLLTSKGETWRSLAGPEAIPKSDLPAASAPSLLSLRNGCRHKALVTEGPQIEVPAPPVTDSGRGLLILDGAQGRYDEGLGHTRPPEFSRPARLAATVAAAAAGQVSGQPSHLNVIFLVLLAGSSRSIRQRRRRPCALARLTSSSRPRWMDDRTSHTTEATH